MPDTVLPGPISSSNGVTEAVCIHTAKVYDACRDKDCVEDLRVYLTRTSQSIADQAISLKTSSAELLWVYIDVESVPFNRGYYTVDATYFYRITANAYTGAGRPQAIEGLAVYDKRALLFGSEGNAKIFSSRVRIADLDRQELAKTNMPSAVVEAVDPIALSIRMVDSSEACTPELQQPEIPEYVLSFFGGELNFQNVSRRVYVSLGQFSLIRLERDTQLLIPAFDFSLPERECGNSDGGTPCDLFENVDFPVGDFFPPASFDCSCGCGCSG